MTDPADVVVSARAGPGRDAGVAWVSVRDVEIETSARLGNAKELTVSVADRSLSVVVSAGKARVLARELERVGDAD